MPVLIENKKVYFDYEVLEKYEAGLELYGHEVKSLKTHRGNIKGSRVIARGSEVFLVGMDIPPYQPKNTPPEYESQRTRRLLLHRKEISHLAGKAEERGLTIIATRVYTVRGRIKVEIALVRGKKKYEKREKIKKRDVEREIRRRVKR